MSQASSVAQYSPNMSELLGFLPTPKTHPDAPTGQDPSQKPILRLVIQLWRQDACRC